MARASEVMTGAAALANERREVIRQVGALFGEEVFPDLAMLDLVRRRLISHFHTEEELMWRTGYPGVYAHLEEHAKLAAYVASLREEIEEDEEDEEVPDPDLIAVSNRLLGNWVLTHVNTHDQKLERYLRALVSD